MNRGDQRDRRPAPNRVMSTPRARTTTTRSDDQASAEHRRKLEAMFSGGASLSAEPARVAPRVFASPRKTMGREPSEFRRRLETLRNAREPEEIEKAADLFLQHHQYPDDLDILLKLLLHPSEKVLRDAMGQISSLIMQGRVGNTLILLDRLGDIGGRDIEATTRSYVEGLKNQLAAQQR